MADSLEERARRFALSRMDDWGVKGGRLTGSDLTRAWLDGYRACAEDAAGIMDRLAYGDAAELFVDAACRIRALAAPSTPTTPE